MAGLAVPGLAQGWTFCDQNSASECCFQICPDLSLEVEEQKADLLCCSGNFSPLCFSSGADRRGFPGVLLLNP